MAKSKREKANEARKNAEAIKARKKQMRAAKGSVAIAAATKGRKAPSLIKQSAKKK
jgi:G:T/U-mismatch repair DNA glycosylase